MSKRHVWLNFKLRHYVQLLMSMAQRKIRSLLQSEYMYRTVGYMYAHMKMVVSTLILKSDDQHVQPMTWLSLFNSKLYFFSGLHLKLNTKIFNV